MPSPVRHLAAARHRSCLRHWSLYLKIGASDPVYNLMFCTVAVLH
uniref:Uncharacterized protein n=1 Tax=Oryza sativa subsp. japonica TaxID=39947 RepID=Q2QRW9_ORYSJ|nr:hypothetical protein LOC_Os12g26129 [Oryza sativa Japonica Group]